MVGMTNGVHGVWVCALSIAIVALSVLMCGERGFELGCEVCQCGIGRPLGRRLRRKSL